MDTWLWRLTYVLAFLVAFKVGAWLVKKHRDKRMVSKIVDEEVEKWLKEKKDEEESKS